MLSSTAFARIMKQSLVDFDLPSDVLAGQLPCTGSGDSWNAFYFFKEGISGHKFIMDTLEDNVVRRM